MFSEFPQLRGYEKEIDKVLVTTLIQAKFYQKKKIKDSAAAVPPVSECVLSRMTLSKGTYNVILIASCKI